MAIQQCRRYMLCEAIVAGACMISLLIMQCAAFVRPSSPSTLTGARNHDIALNENSNSVIEEQGGMILASDKNLLNMAFSSLDDKDKYETVLTGLCAKVIDGGSSTAKEGLVDPIRLIEEMNSSGIVAGQRSIISLVDATAMASDARTMAKILSLAIQNGAISNYGTLQSTVNPFPRKSSFSPFGSNNQQLDRLQNLPPVPDDDRAAEISQAITFATVIGSCLAINIFGGLFGLDDLAPWTSLILGITIVTVVVDNFFDVLVMGGSAVAKMNEDKLPESAKNMNSPKKEEMPLGLGTGSITGSVVRGLSRLFSVNTERDCQCEAASVFAAYSLGLPCFAFQPNALEGAALVVESMKNESDDTVQGKLDNLASDAGILKVLIWLMAPVAMEISKHPQLISSDPREAYGFLQRLNEKSQNILSNELSAALPEDDSQAYDYMRWSLAEADLLLRNNRKVVDSLSEALAGGAATVGDCVAILESW